jgi:hypothetical protein
VSEEILDECNDFVDIWDRTYYDKSTGELRPAGGPFTVSSSGVPGANYDELIAWAKGNSVSTDQHSIHDFVEYFEMLFNRMREFLVEQDVKGTSSGLAGLTYDDLDKKGALRSRHNSSYGAGVPTPKARIIEVLACRLLNSNLIAIYENKATRATPVETTIKGELTSTSWACFGDESFYRARGIVQYLGNNKESHIRLTESWEVFVRDHFGVPGGVSGAIAGSLKHVSLAKVPAATAKTMPFPIHYALAEAFAKFRKLEVQKLNQWGKNQLRVRQDLCDIAHAKGSSTITLNEYYNVYKKYGVLHMADSELARSQVDSTRPNYVLSEIPASSPKQWTVELDPGLIRWRNYHRTRGRARASTSASAGGSSSAGGGATGSGASGSSAPTSTGSSSVSSGSKKTP